MRFVSKKAGGVVTCEEDRQKKRGYGRKVVVGGGKRGTLGSLGTHVATSKFSHVQQIVFVVVVLAVVFFFSFFFEIFCFTHKSRASPGDNIVGSAALCTVGPSWPAPHGGSVARIFHNKF